MGKLERKIIWDGTIIFMNKNSIFGWASFVLTLLGIALILLGVLKYPDYAIGFSVVGVGFIAIGWAFNALKGRI